MSPFELGIPLQRLIPQGLTRGSVGLVATLYDLIPLVYAHEYLKDERVRIEYTARLRLLKQADHLVAISETTKADAVRVLNLDPDRVSVIYGGVSDDFRAPAGPLDEVRARIRQAFPELREPFILYTGGIEYRKNMTGLIDGFQAAGPSVYGSHLLVMVCSALPEQKAELLRHASSRGIGDRVVLTGYVTDHQLIELYQACDLFVFPSLYEGLGLPILEAMKCGAPVITSGRGSMKELVENPVAHFNPENPDDIGEAIRRVLGSDVLRQRLVQESAERVREFTWERVATRTMRAYEQVASRRTRGRTSSTGLRPHIAFCTPHPPQQSGVADYGKALVDALSRYPVALDVVVSDAGVASANGPGTILPAQFRLLARRGQYDAILYAMGNSEFHGYVYELLKEFPGIVMLHDARLTGFYNWYRATQGAGWQLPEVVRTTLARHGLDPDGTLGAFARENRLGVFLSGEVVRLATEIVVHSQFAADIVRLEGGRRDVWVTPHPVFPIDENEVEPWPSLAERYGLALDSRIIVSTGLVADTKCPESLIEAFAAVRRHEHAAVLVFVGPAAGYRSCLDPLVTKLGLNRQVLFTEHVPESELTGWLKAAACSVLLRYPSNGESSGSVMRSLAVGCPTIVTDVGAMRELPEAAVERVSAPPDAHGVAAAILRVLTDPEVGRRMSEAGLDYAAKHTFDDLADFVWQRVLKFSSAHLATKARSKGPRAPRNGSYRAALTELPDGSVIGSLASDHRRIEVVVGAEAEDPISRALIAGTFPKEPHCQLMMSLLRPGQRLLDLGAHLGVFSLPGAAAGFEVVAMEASPRNAALLRASAARNGFKNMKVVQAAVSSQPGTLDFIENGPWGHVPATQGADPLPLTIQVRAVTVDELVRELGWESLDFVKMDIEGWELPALSGMSETIRRMNVPYIVYESNGVILHLRGETTEGLRAAFEAHGYRNYLVLQGRLAPMEATDFQPLSWCDYLATKVELDDLPGWTISPLGEEEILELLLPECSSSRDEIRAYAAYTLEYAPAWLLQEPRIQSALADLRTDPNPSVTSAAAWSASWNKPLRPVSQEVGPV
jgi:FkbM family methyltransferase